MSKRLTEGEIKYLAAYDDIPIVGEPEFPECEEPAPDITDEGWWPDLGPTQMEMFNCDKKYILAHGERGSGKGIGLTHKCVRHAMMNWDALVIMTSLGLSGQTLGGPWFDLYSFILPMWESNIGLKWVGPRMDTSRNAYVRVANIYGGWSTIMLKSIPSESVITARFKGTAPSMIFFDELTEAKSAAYIKKLGQQVGRRRGVKCQQFLAACNPSPEGQDNWVYRMFLEEPEKEHDRKYWNDHYAAFHVPMTENIWMENKEAYVEDLKHLAKDDPTEYDRIVNGIWTKQMVGDSIFSNYFQEKTHVKGNAAKGRRFVLQPNLTMTVGYDMGDVNNGVTFLQQIPVKEKTIWVQLDEIVTIDKKIPLISFVRIVLGRINEVIMRAAEAKGLTVTQARNQFYVEHIGDNSTKRFRQAGGDVENQLIWDISKLELEENPEVYPYVVDPIWIRPAPKGDGSPEQRSKLIIDLLQNNRLLIDSGCKNTIDMFMNIVAKKDSIFAPATRSKFKHVLDALGYPIIEYAVHGTPAPRAQRIQPMVY
jgi:phage terminase large subunit